MLAAYRTSAELQRCSAMLAARRSIPAAGRLRWQCCDLGVGLLHLGGRLARGMGLWGRRQFGAHGIDHPRGEGLTSRTGGLTRRGHDIVRDAQGEHFRASGGPSHGRGVSHSAGCNTLFSV